VRYIKRLVGMPNEVIRIDGGDLWVRPLDASGDFERLLRTLDHQRAMQLPVYDDAHQAAAFESDSHWQRWVSVPAQSWAQPTRGTYAPNAKASGWADLRYHHVVPSPAQWEATLTGEPLPNPPVPSLITDYYSYNTDVSARDRSRGGGGARAWFQPHWVGDLTVSLRLTTHEAAGKFRLELIRAGVSHRCEIDLITGMAQLFRGDAVMGEAVRTEITRPGVYDLSMANVDGRMTVWINGHLPFGTGQTYDSGREPPVPTAADLEPVRIATNRAAIEVDSLVLRRDVYYTLEPAESDYSNLDGSARTDPSALYGLLADPARFPSLSRYPAREYPIRKGHYMMLGDNSPWSRDGRAWGNSDQIDPDLPGQGWEQSGRQSWEVPEALLIGKAFCVYWPHPKLVWPRLRLSTDTRLPILPSVERMRLIR
jgi:signal peptidase I